MANHMRRLSEKDEKTLHEIMQPLNIIRLSCGNIRAKISNCDCEDTEYIIEKMVRIEDQMVRAAQLLQKLHRSLDKAE